MGKQKLTYDKYKLKILLVAKSIYKILGCPKIQEYILVERTKGKA